MYLVDLRKFWFMREDYFICNVVLLMGVKGFKVMESDHTRTGISTDCYRSCLRLSVRQSSSVPGDKGRDAASNYTDI
jgi:hypothetical protein